MEKLKAENEEALAIRRALEDEMINTKAQLDSMHSAQDSLQQELDGMRTQVGAALLSRSLLLSRCYPLDAYYSPDVYDWLV